ncbi:MAG: 7-carboxy-7-deazaguanine synthase QueE, partial [Acidobacteriota bacterium]|nr:7-carboxy-7-deazaguanine synthase QueE [Acidobacteriota bacterium]
DRDEVKFVVAGRADWDFALEVVEKYELGGRALAVLVSPVWGQIDLRELADLVSASGLRNARMQLQLHKYIWGPEVHGV